MAESIVTGDMGHCIICGSPNVQVHHLLSGTANRKLSDEDGLTVPLCAECHAKVHAQADISRWTKILGEFAYCSHRIETGEAGGMREARAQFLRRYGKNYI